MIILGLNAYHGDSAAALVVDGELVAAVEEERFRRIKHWAGLPVEAVRYCLTSQSLSLKDVDVIAINQDSSANFLKKISFTLTKRPDLGLILKKLQTRKERESVEQQLQRELGQLFHGSLVAVEHHEAHLASAFFVSPFERAAVVSVDGFGDFASTAWGLGEGTELTIDDKVYFPHSLGNFYQALTQYLGFPNYGDEYKVMGLAPYGKPAFLDRMREIVRLTPAGFELNLDYFRHHVENVTFEWQDGAPVFDRIFTEALEDLLGPARSADQPLQDTHRDIAHSVQAMYEEAFFHILGLVHGLHGGKEIALAGGCAMNSVANGKVHERSEFERVFVQAAAGDAGGAIGAAFSVWHREGQPRSFQMNHAYWGPSFSDTDISDALAARADELEAFEVNRMSETDMIRQVVTAISEGKVVGWFHGRLEWGPRALGHRSILCDPRRSDMKSILNEKIKRRESFRPFAPSVLREFVDDWFEHDDDVPFMMKVFRIRREKRDQIPAVTHVDGSGRLQTVAEASSGRYYRLIKLFCDETGVPMLLNTSFNENEPIVCQPEEALDCFLRTNMDILVLEDHFIRRQ